VIIDLRQETCRSSRCAGCRHVISLARLPVDLGSYGCSSAYRHRRRQMLAYLKALVL